MTSNDQPTRPLPRGRLVAATLGALAGAALIVLGAILPAEFGRDPLGLGKVSGIARLWAPDQVEADVSAAAVPRAREYPAGYRSDVIEIPLGTVSGGAAPYELEYKVAMKKDATLVYEWQAIGVQNPDDIYYDFHGHTLTGASGEKMIVATYKQATGEAQQGALTAPFDGIQGWFFQNSALRPVVIRVKVSGFYELIPSGQPGNEAGVVANVPAAAARPAMAASR